MMYFRTGDELHILPRIQFPYYNNSLSWNIDPGIDCNSKEKTILMSG